MVINRNIVRKEIVGCLISIDAQIDEVKVSAKKIDQKPEKMRDANGNWVMSPLLLAKVTALQTIVVLDYSERPK